MATVGIYFMSSTLSRLFDPGQEAPDLSELIQSLLQGEPDQDYNQEEMTINQGRQKGFGQPGQVAEDPEGFIHGRAAEFATARDLMDYSRNRSLATGDNGIGAWGDFTAGNQAFVAVPRDLIAKRYGNENAGRGKMVQVISPNGESKIIPIGDKGPALANRANNAVIELNPAAKQLLGSGDSPGYRYKLLD